MDVEYVQSMSIMLLLSMLVTMVLHIQRLEKACGLTSWLIFDVVAPRL